MSERYIICDYCSDRVSDWSVLVDEAGNITGVECSECGGNDWFRRGW